MYINCIAFVLLSCALAHGEEETDQSGINPLGLLSHGLRRLPLGEHRERILGILGMDSKRKVDANSESSSAVRPITSGNDSSNYSSRIAELGKTILNRAACGIGSFFGGSSNSCA